MSQSPGDAGTAQRPAAGEDSSSRRSFPPDLHAIPGASDPRRKSSGGNASSAPDPEPTSAATDALIARIARLERRVRLQLFALIIVVALGLGITFRELLIEDVIVKQKLMESKELTLLDNDGNARLFLRMYSKVPVLQIMDSNGKPRMSLGLRFDDTPFLDLSDKRGRTRATFEMTEDDSPALRLFDESGEPTFKIN